MRRDPLIDEETYPGHKTKLWIVYSFR